MISSIQRSGNVVRATFRSCKGSASSVGQGTTAPKPKAVAEGVADTVAEPNNPTPTEILDVADVAEPEGDEGKKDRTYPFIPKWGQPVDGAELLNELAAVFKKHLVTSDGAA